MYVFETITHLPPPAALQTVQVNDTFWARGWDEFFVTANVMASQLQIMWLI